MGKEEIPFGTSVDAKLEELMTELRQNRRSIISAPVGSKRYESVDRIITAMEEHPLKIEQRWENQLMRIGVLPLVDYKDKYHFGILYEGESTNRTPADIIVNLEDRLFCRDEFNVDNCRFVLLNRIEYNTLRRAIAGEIPKTKQQVKLEPTIAIEDIDKMHQLLYGVVCKAIDQRATDIHFEREAENKTKVRFRIDGNLVTYDDTMMPDVLKRLISATKTLAEVKSYDPFDAQDGSITFKPEVVEHYPKLRGYSLRLSTVPIKYDQGRREVDRLVLRIHEAEIGRKPLCELGFAEKIVAKIHDIVSASQGLMIVTGPTGSGKTTTLYSVLDYLNTDERNIITIEDPIEAFIPGLSQSQVNEDRGWTFAKVLKHYLRQDPDVILVGEARDETTTELLFRAAETGHFVFSTMHTNSAYDSLPRIYSMGIAPTYVLSSLSAVLSQRLARILCEECREEYDARAELNSYFRSADIKDEVPLFRAVRGKDCNICRGTGYYGRTAVPELWVIDDKAQDLIASGESYPSTYRIAATEMGAKTLMQNGFELVLSGKTSLEEIARFARSGLYNEQKYLLPMIKEH